MACAGRYVGTDGIYTHTAQYERDAQCLVCGAGVPMHISPSATLQEVRQPPTPPQLPVCHAHMSWWNLWRHL